MPRIQSFEVRTTTREEIVDVTDRVRALVRRTGIRDGVVWVTVRHTTAAVTLQENADPTVKSDALRWLSRTIPRDGDFDHDEGNADAHLKAGLLGSTQAILLEDGELALGRWQGVWFCEFDGPRVREVHLKVVAG
jgi:secondary thiamine-phosphate synthase enzyme